MQPVMRARVVRIGNSRGIRIPKVWLEQLGLTDEVEMAVHKDGLLIRRPTRSREGWAQAFQAMAAHKDDRLLDKPAVGRWDAEEWEW
jgi:antitoxin MazE